MDNKNLGKEELLDGIEKTVFSHFMPIQIRFNDIDTLGHVNNSVYFNFFDLGKADYFASVKGENVDWKRVDIVVANINCDFLAPMFFDEKIEVQTRVSEIRTSSFKMIQNLVNTVTGEIKCVCTTIMVGFDIDKQSSAPLSKEWIEGLNKYEGRNLCVNKKKQ